MTALKKNYPRHVDVLRLEVARAIQLQSPEMADDRVNIELRQRKGDAMIKEFMAQSLGDMTSALLDRVVSF